MSLRRVGANLLLLVIATCLSLGIAEGLSRIVLPLSAGSQIVQITALENGGRILHALSNEYDKRYVETAQGYRAPAVADPQIVFIGDSFTYGIGLNDDESFPYLYCRAVESRCANLGVPNSGTGLQVRRLRRFLEEGWRPQEVKLFMLVMVDYLGAGNDLLDNLDSAEQEHDPLDGRMADAGETVKVAYKVAETRRGADSKPDTNNDARFSLIDVGRGSLRYSNLARVLYYKLGPQIRAVLSPEPERRKLDRALGITAGHLNELEAMSRQYGFDDRIYLIHPMQDIINGTDENTTEMMSAAFERDIVSTRPAFADNVKSYYYNYDGHLNPKGSQAIAAFLVRLDEGRQNR